jgi:hypothetical protein
VRRAFLLAAVLAACSTPSGQDQLGVEVFSDDTVAVQFTVTINDALEMNVDAERSFVRPDKSIVFQTPAKLRVTKGTGASLISALDGAQRIAVQPMGVSADSAEHETVVGSVVKISRLADAPRLRLEVAKP